MAFATSSRFAAGVAASASFSRNASGSATASLSSSTLSISASAGKTSSHASGTINGSTFGRALAIRKRMATRWLTFPRLSKNSAGLAMAPRSSSAVSMSSNAGRTSAHVIGAGKCFSTAGRSWWSSSLTANGDDASSRRSRKPSKSLTASRISLAVSRRRSTGNTSSHVSPYFSSRGALSLGSRCGRAASIILARTAVGRSPGKATISLVR